MRIEAVMVICFRCCWKRQRLRLACKTDGADEIAADAVTPWWELLLVSEMTGFLVREFQFKFDSVNKTEYRRTVKAEENQLWTEPIDEGIVLA